MFVSILISSFFDNLNNLPKHMPHKPWRIVKITTRTRFPLHSTPKTAIMKIKTRAVCPTMTTNCVMTWENKISSGVTPEKETNIYILKSSSTRSFQRRKCEDTRAIRKSKLEYIDINAKIHGPFWNLSFNISVRLDSYCLHSKLR